MPILNRSKTLTFMLGCLIVGGDLALVHQSAKSADRTKTASLWDAAATPARTRL
jgi:hypothetical protein